MDRNPVILFDGVCNLCNNAVDFIIRHDKKKIFRFASLQSEAAKKMLALTQPDNDSLDSVILIENDKVYTRSTAALRITRYLDKGWPLLYSLIIFPRIIRDWQYNFIAKRRYKWFGKKSSCRIPTEAEKQLFLD